MNQAYFLFLFSALLLASCDVRKSDKQIIGATGQTKVAHTEKPTTVQVIDTVYNFGSKVEGEIVEYNYRFKNTGQEPLVVYAAQASCGCTVPEKPEHPVKPGEIGVIKVKFDSKNRPGEVKKTITVSSNAVPAFPVLVLEGDVIGNKE